MHCPDCHTIMKWDGKKKTNICPNCGLVQSEWVKKAKAFMETQEFADAMEEIKARYK